MSSSRALCKKVHGPLRMPITQDAVHAHGSRVRWTPKFYPRQCGNVRAMRYMQDDSMSFPGETRTSTLTISEGCNSHYYSRISSVSTHLINRFAESALHRCWQ